MPIDTLSGVVSERYLIGMRGGGGGGGTCSSFAEECKAQLDEHGVITLHEFLTPSAVAELVKEAEARAGEAFFTSSTHNVWLTEKDTSKENVHIYNRQLRSGKGCIQHDQIPQSSKLRALYDDGSFRRFVAAVVGEKELFEYADTLSGINVHYAGDGKNLNWHFDNSSFAVTLLLQSPKGGGQFQYVKDVRCQSQPQSDEFARVEEIVDGIEQPTTLQMRPGTLVLFRGRNSIHRVTPTEGDRQRILAVFAFNSQPGIALSETARLTFFGRLA